MKDTRTSFFLKGEQIRNAMSLFADCETFYLIFLWHVKINMMSFVFNILYICCTGLCSSPSTCSVRSLDDRSNCNTFCICWTHRDTGDSKRASSKGRLEFLHSARKLPKLKSMRQTRQVSSCFRPRESFCCSSLVLQN